MKGLGWNGVQALGEVQYRYVGTIDCVADRLILDISAT